MSQNGRTCVSVCVRVRVCVCVCLCLSTTTSYRQCTYLRNKYPGSIIWNWSWLNVWSAKNTSQTKQVITCFSGGLSNEAGTSQVTIMAIKQLINRIPFQKHYHLSQYQNLSVCYQVPFCCLLPQTAPHILMFDKLFTWRSKFTFRYKYSSILPQHSKFWVLGHVITRRVPAQWMHITSSQWSESM